MRRPIMSAAVRLSSYHKTPIIDAIKVGILAAGSVDRVLQLTLASGVEG